MKAEAIRWKGGEASPRKAEGREVEEEKAKKNEEEGEAQKKETVEEVQRASQKGKTERAQHVDVEYREKVHDKIQRKV